MQLWRRLPSELDEVAGEDMRKRMTGLLALVVGFGLHFTRRSYLHHPGFDDEWRQVGQCVLMLRENT